MTHDLLRRARAEGTPLLDGDRATFVWEGESAPRLVADFNSWGWSAGDLATRSASETLERVAPGVWAGTVELPRDAYIEYAYRREDGSRLPDPFNARTIWNGMDADNSYFGMPDYLPTPLDRRRSGVPCGRVRRHVVRGEHLVAGGSRAVHLYQPPTDDPAPLLVVFDGQDYLRRAKLPTIVDNLIAAGRIRPVALAMVEHGDQARYLEYAQSEATLAFLARHVLPLAQEQLRLTDGAGEWGVLGASLGGLISLYAALRLPDTFGRVISQSGAFGLELAGAEPLILDLVRHARATSPRVWMDVGRYEWLLEANRRMRDTLASAGFQVACHEYSGGHNYTCWRDEVPSALEAQFAE
jgi:enterochelin esterase-like enzyme